MKSKVQRQNPSSKGSLVFVGDYTPCSNSNLPTSFMGARLIGNIECSISDSPLDSGKAYSILMQSHCCEQIASHNFTALNVANNHVYDGGSKQFDNMLTLLRKTLPNVQLYGLKEKPYAEIDIDNKRIAIIGCLEPCRSRGRRLFREEDVTGLLRRIKPHYDYIFITPHWGKEGEYAFHPSPWQRRSAHHWIAAGADGIFGHHSHTIHGHEEISGKPVFYSLGNFLFNHEEGSKYPLTTLGLAVEYGIENRGVWQHRFFVQDGFSIKYIDSGPLNQSNDFLEKVSIHITSKAWTMKQWAKKVGPIYIAKSKASWKIRFRRGPFYKVFPLWFVWFFLPVNLVLRWGSINKSETVFKDAKDLDLNL